MTVVARALGYLVLLLMMAVLLPYIVGLAVWDWIRVFRGKAAPSPFIPEHPDSQRAWIETMERGRATQRKEEE